MNAIEVWKIAIDPTDPDIIFAGTRPAALYRSTDGGRNWRKLAADIVEECPNVGIPRVTALTIDPSDHRVVWAGIEVDGVRRSTDAGDSWSRITNGVYDPDIHDIAVTVNGGTPNGTTTVLTSTPGEIFASGDRGESWQGLGVRDQFSLRYCRGLAQKADDPETLFAATGDAAVGSTGAIERSRNGGKSWETRPLPVEPNSPIWAFATHPANSARIVGEPLRRGLRQRERRQFVAQAAPRIHRNPCPVLGSELTTASTGAGTHRRARAFPESAYSATLS